MISLTSSGTVSEFTFSYSPAFVLIYNPRELPFPWGGEDSPSKVMLNHEVKFSINNVLIELQLLNAPEPIFVIFFNNSIEVMLALENALS